MPVIRLMTGVSRTDREHKQIVILEAFHINHRLEALRSSQGYDGGSHNVWRVRRVKFNMRYQWRSGRSNDRESHHSVDKQTSTSTAKPERVV
jgi:hypothetical protein